MLILSHRKINLPEVQLSLILPNNPTFDFGCCEWHLLLRAMDRWTMLRRIWRSCMYYHIPVFFLNAGKEVRSFAISGLRRGFSWIFPNEMGNGESILQDLEGRSSSVCSKKPQGNTGFDTLYQSVLRRANGTRVFIVVISDPIMTVYNLAVTFSWSVLPV